MLPVFLQGLSLGLAFLAPYRHAEPLRHQQRVKSYTFTRALATSRSYILGHLPGSYVFLGSRGAHGCVSVA